MTAAIEHSKLRSYVTFKDKIRLEKYLLAGSNYLGRAYHTSLRTGSNVLEIDQGRRQGLEAEFRFCTRCDFKAVESEKHFILECSNYNDLRNNLFASILAVSRGKWDFTSRSTDECFILLMKGTGDEFEAPIFRIFHKHLERCFYRRSSEEAS